MKSANVSLANITVVLDFILTPAGMEANVFQCHCRNVSLIGMGARVHKVAEDVINTAHNFQHHA